MWEILPFSNIWMLHALPLLMQ